MKNQQIYPANTLQTGVICRPASGQNPSQYGTLQKYGSGLYYIEYETGHREVISPNEKVILK